MSTKKFDFACIYYANELMVKMEEQNLFAENLVLPEKLRYIVMQLVQNNYDALGTLGISEEQTVKALEHAQKLSYQATLDEMVKEGLAAYTGIDDQGDYLIKITEAGKKEDERAQEMIRVAKQIRGLYNQTPPVEPPEKI
jgi:hypothetical protein